MKNPLFNLGPLVVTPFLLIIVAIVYFVFVHKS